MKCKCYQLLVPEARPLSPVSLKGRVVRDGSPPAFREATPLVTLVLPGRSPVSPFSLYQEQHPSIHLLLVTPKHLPF